MTKKYIQVRVPKEAYDNLRIKQDRMQRTASEITGKSIKIPITKVLNTILARPFNLEDETLVKMSRRRGKRKVEVRRIVI